MDVVKTTLAPYVCKRHKYEYLQLTE